MAIKTEFQVYVDCDRCGEYYVTQIMTQKEGMCFLRAKDCGVVERERK